MAFNIDPANFLGNAIQGIIGQPIVIGLPSPQAIVPNFVIGIMPTEEAHGSITLPSLQLQGGDLFQKSAVNGGQYNFDFVISSDPQLNATWIPLVATILQQFTGALNSLANFGAVVPSLTGVTSNYAMSQLGVLYAIKNNTQPLLILNSYINLGAISQKNPYLQSGWYIESISAPREEAMGGVVVSVQCKELLSALNSNSKAGIVENIANAIVGPGAGSSIASLI